jgi:NAD kinase
MAMPRRRDLPRIVLVTRKTSLELLLERHGTAGQVRFYLETKGQHLAPYEEAQARQDDALTVVLRAVPPEQPRTRLDRRDLDRFVFNRDDLVVVVGQDGLVPNVAKYVDGQLVIGVNPDPSRYDGRLCAHPPTAVADLLAWVQQRDSRFAVQPRVMALARREDGQTLRALNDIYLGSRTHQSARYVLHAGKREERQSSSGILVGTGTGSTGWCLSLARQLGLEDRLPQPVERRLVWFVREPWPSRTTGTDLAFGGIAEDEALIVTSELGENGVIFADGIETDWIEFLDGQQVTITLAPEALHLVVPTKPLAPGSGSDAPGASRP